MINEKAIVDYFEDLARWNKKIRHTSDKKAFSHGDIDELLNDISGHKTDGFSLLYENGDGSIEGQNEDQTIDQSKSAIIVVRPVVEGDKNDQIQAETDAKKIAFSIIAKMEKDKDDGVDLVSEFDVLSVKYMKIYGFGNNHFGYRVEFNLISSGLEAYNENDWDYSL